ncbi:hypothetical protein H310_07888 [Aphanomyces invadans]|uniref:USP domain-containing protein n=1 Tax=Aphanomyces invadans TaxID=157072 RepID=A0A024U0B8_9STRA|nr:hypothetical protein H310_07888 [Aphanomyces invadans]ETV99850.1 hypothetical protein H310_07888 [Aphanomyces invadans]|eukprot:XP_008871626.1 hypothetical protein H310_07888 [Aphanomyces invadans]
MWSSMLGLPDTILRQSVAEARLGEVETRRATQAFHRASGHGQMTKQVFVHSVVRELLPNFPMPLAERLFGCINVDLSGMLKYKEFISTVCVLKVGTPREQLKLVFRVLDSTESGYITRKDVRTMLSWVMASTPNSFDATDGGGMPWTAATFESTLFVMAEKIKWETFRNRMTTSSGQVCQGGLILVSWVHSLGLAMTFQESSLPTTPVAVVAAPSAMLAMSNELTTTPSTLHVLKLYSSSTALYGDRKTTLHHHFHRLHAAYGHGVGIPRAVIHSAFASTFVFPSAYLDCVASDSRDQHADDAPTLRDWMMHLTFAAHASMLEGLRCLFDLFVDVTNSTSPPSPTSSVVSDLAELVYHLVPAPTFVLNRPFWQSHIAPPPLPHDVAQWTDQLVVDSDKAHVTFADFCGWLSGQQPALLHALHECCDMVHVRLLGDKVKPETAVQVVLGLLQVYDSATNAGVPGQEWYRTSAAMWQPFLDFDDNHELEAKLRLTAPDHDGATITQLDHVFVNRATFDALCRWHPTVAAACATTRPPPPLALDDVFVRITNDQRQLEQSLFVIHVVSNNTGVSPSPDQRLHAMSPESTSIDSCAARPDQPRQEDRAARSSVVMLSGRTPQQYAPVLVRMATGGPFAAPFTSSAPFYRPAGADKWLPWPVEQSTPTGAAPTLAELAPDVTLVEMTWQNDLHAANDGAVAPPPTPPSDVVDGATLGPTPAAVGLSNLGNSCFMNAVLQCLFHTMPLQEYFVSDEYLYDLNVWNKYGMQGVFAAVYGELARVMSSNRSRPIAPLTFKLAIGKLYPQFQGHLQHDAHECLSVLLQGLSEDLSRPLRAPSLSPSALKSTIQTVKPYVDLPDSNGRPDADVAFEWWRAHVLRDPSIVTALFTGQFKSALDCSACGQTSNRFEPFSFLQVPLPPSLQRWRTVYVHVGHGRPIQKRKVRLDSRATTADLVAALRHQDKELPDASSSDPVQIVAILHGHKIHTIVQPKQLLVDIAQDLHVYSYQGVAHPSTPGAPSPSRRWQCVYRRQRLVPFYFLHPFRVQLYGSPFLLPSTARMTGHELYAWVHTHQPPPATSSQDVDKAIYFALPSAAHPTWPFTIRYVRATDGLACSRCPWTSSCVGCPVVPCARNSSGHHGTLDDDMHPRDDARDEIVMLQPHEMLAIDWGIETAAAPPELHSSYVQFHATPPPAHPLEDCIGMLCSQETVDMYCSKCTTSLPHTKRLALWSTPPILVVQLKRFQTISETQSMVKAETSIRFPTTLSLARFLATTSNGTPLDISTAPHNNVVATTYGDPDDATTHDAGNNDHVLPIPTTFVWKNDISVTFPYPTATAAPHHQDYNLYGIVCHVGVLGAGHYIAYVHEAGTWWCVDDMTVTAVADLNLSKLMCAAYLLFYERKDMESVAMDKWFKRAETAHGSGIQVNVDDLRRQVHTWTKPQGGGTTQHVRSKSKYWLNWTWR